MIEGVLILLSVWHARSIPASIAFHNYFNWNPAQWRPRFLVSLSPTLWIALAWVLHGTGWPVVLGIGIVVSFVHLVMLRLLSNRV